MITKQQLEIYAKKKNYNLGQAEKDYYQDIILFILYTNFKDKIVFKGGTALTKCFGLDRFSEDLDFNAQDTDYTKIINKGLEEFYIDYELIQKKHANSIDLTYKIKGPLYNGQKNSICKILIDLSLRETAKETQLKKIGWNNEQIPVFDVIVMIEKEILSEKIRAILTRNKARDLYDTNYLITKGVTTTKTRINEKLLQHNKKFDLIEFEKKLDEKEKIWDSELKPIVKSYPKFNIVKKTILTWIKTINKKSD
ncbi:MAG: nucleotidyl transferase AbiEii/AbiGii toxin family protein [Candidatus ainarchaeum sp.]|nr:nucleotidyl transferase AbiEii/AbiGii toxin family protein [Candidatus ainarchaeum sp.]